jgi:hypothetical protein
MTKAEQARVLAWRFHLVEGSNHMQLYDGEKEVSEAVSVLAPFFKSTL